MRNIKLTLSYDGTDFHGWQIQPEKPTIQGAVADALSRVANEVITVYGAGRTDAGVHALGQVAHFLTVSRMSPQEFQRALNSLLPVSVRIVGAEETAADFHARHHAIGKTYCYRIFRGRILPPFLSRYVLHHPGPLDEEAMSNAAVAFQGEHDFTTFSASPDNDEDDDAKLPNPVRKISGSQILKVPLQPAPGIVPAEVRADPSDYELVYHVRGRSFLRYMVRKMVGTLFEVGRGRLQPADIPALFELRDRAKSGPTVPPHGLFLEAVEYPTQK